MTPRIEHADPFDLPEWLGTTPVTWYAEEGHRWGHHIRGRFVPDHADLAPSDPSDRSDPSEDVVCDVLAIDQA